MKLGTTRSLRLTDDGQAFHQRCLRIRKNRLAPDHPDIGRCLDGLASVSEAKGDCLKAEQLETQALDITKRRRGAG